MWFWKYGREIIGPILGSFDILGDILKDRVVHKDRSKCFDYFRILIHGVVFLVIYWFSYFRLSTSDSA
jgi:hypothetical protein